MVEVVETYRFTPDLLHVAGRPTGISAFMRIRDGAFSVEAAIRSHIGHFDEIVAVHNRCTDATPEILARLEQEFAPRLRVFHYLPPVFPPGSEGHRTEPPGSPRSLVTYYNFALAATRLSHATKLDDDHVAMSGPTSQLMADVRAGRAANGEMACFSGLNLARDENGQLGILRREPFSGSGDIGVFPVTPETWFAHDRRFEVFRRGGMRRRFWGFAYWHLKYLKPEFGFANYDLGENPGSRYARRRAEHERARAVVGLAELGGLAQPGLALTERGRIVRARDAAARGLFAGEAIDAVLSREPEMAGFL